MQNMKIYSWNIKGLGNPIKRNKVLSLLKKDKADVVFLQETFLSDTEHLKLKRDWIGQVYFSSYKTHSRGTAIVINKTCPFELEKLVTDPNGRFVLVVGTIFGTPITFLNIYAPNIDEPMFMSDMVLLFNENCKGLGLMGGDFNCTLNPTLDKSNQSKSHNLKSSKVLQGLCAESGLIDVWRQLNQDVKDYTFFSNVHNSYSSIDYFCIPSKYMLRVKECKIDSINISDHARVYLTIYLESGELVSRRWKFDNSLLRDEKFKFKNANVDNLLYKRKQ